MGQCLDKLPHSCGTRGGLQVFEADDGSVNGYCFSCRTFVRHPYGKERQADSLPKPKTKTPEEIQEEIAEVSSFPVVDVEKKKLRAETLQEFGVKVGLSEEDGKTPSMLCYPYTKDGEITAYKIKLLDTKRIWSIGDMKEVDLFGWEQALAMGARKLIITEGEDDTIALRRVLQLHSKEEYKDFTAVVSLPHGASSAVEVLTRLMPMVSKYFEDVALCFDMDEPGRTAVNEVCKVFPSMKSIDLPSKDANQCVIDGKAKALYKATFNVGVPKNTRLVFGDDIAEAAMEPPTYGELSWPWDHIQEATRGIRYGETIYVGAGVKMGKSDLLNDMAAHFIKEHDVKVFMAKPEEVNKNTYKRLAGKMVGKIFYDPKIPFDKEAYLEAVRQLSGKVSMVDLYQHVGWESLKNDIKAAVAWGAKVIFIDPITNLTDGMPSGEANIMLEEIAKDVSAMAKDFNVVVFLFCHLRAPEGAIGRETREKLYKNNKFIALGSCPHELGGDIFSNQFAGSRAMMRKCNMMVGLEGNKDPELPSETRNLRNLKILEEREFGASGIYPIYFNSNSGVYVEA